MRTVDRTGLRSLERQLAHRPHHRPTALWPLLVVMGFLALGGFVGGVSFVVDRTGAGLGAKPSWLEPTPVNDFLLPGLFILGVYGLASVILMAGLTWGPSPGPLRRIDARIGFHWSWAGTIAVGAVLIAWILYELAIISDRIVLQPILMVVGALMVAIPLLPSMRRQYATRGR